ncbi:hypothetical protein A9264_13600 [Vibrio sp. UCD-FRSSP16_10]|nr:hypothetical protein A9260_13815 [Vibrio sp. UCD-FRSSP16_30]OBT20095.1 hypothetical protein A9264_13600 [Vibrio sp. UCD-FRSSP16_10]
MYLFKSRYCLYFVRICPPKALVEQGFLFDFKFDLHTKSQPISIRRSAPIVIEVLKPLDSFDSNKDKSLTIQAEISATVAASNRWNGVVIVFMVQLSNPDK